MVLTNCGKWLGWNIIQQLPVDSQMKTFYISIKFIVAFHVNMLQQLHLPVNSIICKHEKILSITFQRVFPARGQLWNKNSQMKKSLKKLQVQTRVENYFSF